MLFERFWSFLRACIGTLFPIESVTSRGRHELFCLLPQSRISNSLGFGENIPGKAEMTVL